MSATLRTVPILPSLQPSGGNCSLLLADLYLRSNRIANKAADLTKPVESAMPKGRSATAIRGQAGSSHPPDCVADYYLDALAEDGWLWEAWTGLCDSGE